MKASFFHETFIGIFTAKAFAKSIVRERDANYTSRFITADSFLPQQTLHWFFSTFSLSLSSLFFITNTFISLAYNRKTKKKANNMNNLLNDYNHQNIPHFQLGFVTAKRRKRKKRKKIISIDKMWMWCTCGFYAENMSEEANIKAYCKINCCFVSCSSI